MTSPEPPPYYGPSFQGGSWQQPVPVSPLRPDKRPGGEGSAGRLPVWVVVLLSAGAALVLCVAGALLITPEEPSRNVREVIAPSSVVTPTTRATSAAPVVPVEPESVKVVEPTADIQGDDLVLVGDDVPAGTYRVVGRVVAEPWCYWGIYSDSQMQNIIANDIVTAGRPQVTLKKGQWFRSNGCPDWAKK
jgi:hypothetical protein